MDKEKLKLIIQLVGLLISVLTVLLAYLQTVAPETVIGVLTGQTVQTAGILCGKGQVDKQATAQ